MVFLAGSTFANWPVIKQIAILLGFVMRGIFLALGAMNIYSITLCVVIFTVITRLLLFPLTLRQQKFTKMTAIMNPELQAIQAKYKNKKDSASVQRMQVEQQMVYEKYGVNMSAGCLPSLLQIVILFALYPVVYNLNQYVPELSKFSESELTAMYTLFGVIDLRSTPTLGFHPSVLIPVLAAAFQFLSTQLMMKNQPQQNSDNPMASSMKTMNYTMPIMSLVFCFSFQCFIGIYWITMSVVMVIQQLVINNMMDKVKVEDLIKENLEKQNKKRAKKGLPPLAGNANINTKAIDREKEIEKRVAERNAKLNMSTADRDAKVKESTEYYKKKSTAKPGSLAAKAGMVKDFNEKNN